MAKKGSRRRVQDDVKEKKGIKPRQKFIIFLVGFTMLVSGLYVGLNPTDVPQSDNSSGVPSFVQYDAVPLGNETVLRVEGKSNAYVVFPKFGSTLQQQDAVSLLQVRPAGVLGATMEVSDSFVLFRYAVNGTGRDVRDALDRSVRGFIRDYTLLEEYKASYFRGPQTALTLLGEVDLSSGSLVKALVLQKMSGSDSLGFIALERSAVAEGRVIPAVILNVSGFRVQGDFEGSFNASVVGGVFPGSSVDSQPPRVVVDGSVPPYFGEGNVSLSKFGNSSVLSVYKGDVSAVELWVSSLGLNYSLERGVVVASLPLNVSISDAERVFASAGAGNLSFMRYGVADVAPELIVDNKSAVVQSPDAFPVIMGLNRKAGDKINVSLTLFDLGNQLIAVYGQEEPAG
ncbi:Uncharacterised protein [uncultured archaeon]|nr:Uncharacterised protein [uncultured archaeon]